MREIMIIGGGTSGLAAAITAAQTARSTGTDAGITVCERLARVGKKLLVTGNGRCNISNRDLSAERFHGKSDFITALTESPEWDNIPFFTSLGIFLAESDGRLYPHSGQAAGVLDALRFECERLNVNTLCSTEITSVVPDGGGYLLNRKLRADKVIFCSGGSAAPDLGTDGKAYALTSSLGHSLNTPSPALTYLRSDERIFRSLKGIRALGTVSVIKNNAVLGTQSGEIQFTEQGVSGIPVFNLSHLVPQKNAIGYFVRMDLCPSVTHAQLSEFISKSVLSNSRAVMPDVLTGLIPKRLAEAVLSSLGFKPAKPLSEYTPSDCARISDALKGLTVDVCGTGDFRNAQVSTGGIPLDEVDALTMRSRRQNGVYICGEMLDLYGDCGGYNLQLAFTTGRIAGKDCILAND